MARNALTILAAVAASCCICLTVSWATQPRTGVAVVDLDEVAKRLGRQTEMQASFQQKTQLTQKKLAAIEQNALAKLEEARKSLGNSPSKEQAVQFQKMQQSAQIQWNQLKQKAEQELSSHRQQLVSQFREQSRPIVAEVAKKHGFATVITRNDMFLFSYEQAVDLTSEVAEIMADNQSFQPASQSQQPAPASEIPAPTQQVKPVQQVKHEVSK